MNFDAKKQKQGFGKPKFEGNNSNNRPMKNSSPVEREARKEEDWMKRSIEQRKLKTKKASGPATFRLGDQLKEALNRVKKI